MKTVQFFKVGILGIVSLLTMACNNSVNTNPDSVLNKEEQSAFKYAIARYIHKLPNRATEENKFESQFDEYYTNKAKYSHLDKYYQTKGDTIYFEMSKIAPSMNEKYTATAGKLLKDKTGKIVYYEEIYRTWKMEKDELSNKTNILFQDLLAHKDLSPYYNANSGKEEYIEFPDSKNVYNVEKRVWVQTFE